MRGKFCFKIFILVVISGCQSKPIEFNDYQIVQEIFKKEEITELKKILSDFDRLICNTELSSSRVLSNCYKNFFNEMKIAAETGNIGAHISSKKVQNLINGVNDKTYKQIWFNPNERNLNTIEKEYITINTNDKYFVFLENFGKVEPKIKKYSVSLKIAGAISPSMVADLIFNHDEYKIQDERIRLMIAIHYLTISEPIENESINKTPMK